MIEKRLFHSQQLTVLVPISSIVSLFSSFFFFPSPFFILFLQPLVKHRRGRRRFGRGGSHRVVLATAWPRLSSLLFAHCRPLKRGRSDISRPDGRTRRSAAACGRRRRACEERSPAGGDQAAHRGSRIEAEGPRAGSQGQTWPHDGERASHREQTQRAACSAAKRVPPGRGDEHSECTARGGVCERAAERTTSRCRRSGAGRPACAQGGRQCRRCR